MKACKHSLGWLLPYPTHTFAAFCRRSPDSPTQMLSTSFDTRISRMGLVTFFSFCAHSTAHVSALWELRKFCKL